MVEPRPFVLCADDYAMTAGVSRGILELAEQGRIGATSVMSNRPAWRDFAAPLRALGPRIAVGLHLNLTLGEPLTRAVSLRDWKSGYEAGLAPLRQIVGRAFAGSLGPAELKAELGAQLDAFAEHFGDMPDFIDGHQHVHVLPIVRRALFDVVQERGLAGRLWLRDPSDGVRAIRARRACARKALAVALFARGFGRQAQAKGIATNQGFAGFSAFPEHGDFGEEFGRFLLAPGPRHLVMCHPGYADDELRSLDPAVEARDRELAFLKSERFERMCEAHGLRLARDWS